MEKLKWQWHGLDIINSNPNDFIISWTPKPTHLSLKGQQLNTQLEIKTDTNMINFSQMERENEDLHQAMIYARAILSFSIFVLFFKDLWNTLMATLGVSTQVYEKDQEEKERINKIHERNEENIRQAYEKQRYREWLRRNAK